MSLFTFTVPGVPVRDVERFMTYVEAFESPGCWPWVGGVSSDGYGVFWYAGKSVRAHRMAFEIVNGPIPEGMLVCHVCDTPRCVRPDHLFLGTNGDNQRDARDKGRLSPHLPTPPTGERWHETHDAGHAVGERAGGAKLTDEAVVQIRARVARGESQNSVAVAYGLSRSTVHKVVHRHAWAHVGGEPCR